MECKINCYKKDETFFLSALCQFSRYNDDCINSPVNRVIISKEDEQLAININKENQVVKDRLFRSPVVNAAPRNIYALH